MSDKKNMFGMPWTEWRNLAGLSDPYAVLSAEQGVPPVLAEGYELQEKVVGDEKSSRSFGPKPGSPAFEKLTDKQKRAIRLVKVVRNPKSEYSKSLKRTRYIQALRGEGERKSGGISSLAAAEKKLKAKKTREAGVKAGQERIAKGNYPPGVPTSREVQACREAIFHDINARYDELMSEFVEMGGDSLEEFHDCLDYALECVFEEVVEEFAEELLWEEFLVQKGLTLEAFDQLADAALMTEDEDEMASILALRDVFRKEVIEADDGEKLKRTMDIVKGLSPTAQTQRQGVQLKKFKSFVHGDTPRTIDWGKKHGGKTTWEPAGGEKKKAAEDVIGDDEEALWEEFLAERGITLEQFHMLMDEAIESGDLEEMDALYQLEGKWQAWKEKRAAEKAAKAKAETEKLLAPVKQGGAIIKKVGQSNVRALNVRGQATHASGGRGR